MAPPRRDPVRFARAEWLFPLALAAWLTWVGLTSTSARHSLLAAVLVTGLYGGLALTLYLAARFAVRAGRLYGLGAALALALAPAAQLRLDAERLQRPLVFLLFVVALAAAAHGWLVRFAPAERRTSPGLLAQAYVALGLLALATLAAARASDELRWHLFRHHRLFADPLYHLGPRSLPAEREALWNAEARLAQPDEFPAQAGTPPVPFERPPHVVFLLLDTLRADALAAHGGASDVMPAVNALAERSVVFTDVQANASWTRASCASIFTGLLPEEHGAARFHERLAEGWLTLPEALRAAGYQTAAFVANWVQVGRETGFAQGFDAPDFHELATGDEILERTGDGAAEQEVRGAYARAEQLQSQALAWLASEERDPYRPLFLYLHYLDPHSPYLEPPEPGTGHDPKERKRGLYRQQLRYLDRQLAQLFESLGEVLPGPKVIVLTSDHGEEFYEHDDWGHGHTLYHELLWVPLVVSLPDGRAGRVDDPLELRDLFTLVQDLVREPGLDLTAWGRSRARAVRYASQYLDRAADARPDEKWTALRRVDARGASLIWSAFGRTFELYDRALDPGELRNQIDRDERAELLRRALEHSVRFWAEPLRVERDAHELEFLRALGYAGGVDAP